jgi:3-deoxy-manno-octulosonate cytidylyltransferase (CMP-KDO synthetase)
VDRLDRPIVLNVQGDEPLLDPNDILLVAATKREHPDDVVNGYHAVGPEEDPTSVNLPKVAIDRDGMLLYMSRSLLPGTKSGAVDRSVEYLKQVCIYGYSAEDLRRFAATEGKGPLEQAEDIEILRFLELGQRVRMVRTAGSSLAVDVPEDVAIVEAALRRRGLGA